MSKKSLGIVVTFAIVVAACGSSSSSKSGSNPYQKSSNTTSSSSTPTGSTSSGATSATLQLANTTLGKVVTDSGGKVLYLYVPDGSATVSTVNPALLAAWPPVKADAAPTLGPGLTAKATTGTQPNGEKWVIYNNHLLYSFSGDPKPGDVNGNGLANVWYAVTAAGEPVQS